MIGIVIPIYNRPKYVQACFSSLLKADIPENTQIILVDDASTDSSVYGLIQTFTPPCNKITITNNANLGVRKTLKKGIEKAFGIGCDIVINLDSDGIVKPDFIERLLEFAGGNIVSGFNCESAVNPVLTVDKGYVLKAYGNGINMCFNQALYDKYIHPSLLKEGNWDYNTSLACQADKIPFIITTPSVVQHIGIESSMGHTGGDFAKDFKMLSLPDVTLFGVDAHDPAGLLRAAEISQRDVDFGGVNVITERLFSGREAYSKFIITQLHKYFNTSHCLIIHPDGYVLNWQAWDDEWLQYDYIGATWWYKDNMNVGNGGFSLRSKKLQTILAQQNIPEQYMHPEDHAICRIYRESLEKDFGIKFAPEEVANNFSIEAYNTPDTRYKGSFGFHGPHVVGLPQGKEFQRKSEVHTPHNAAPTHSIQATRIAGGVHNSNRFNQSRHNARR